NCVGVGPDGRHARFPSLGAISGDWGGGYDLGMAAISAAARSEDGRGPRTSLEGSVPRHFGLQTPTELAEAIHAGRIAQRRAIELAPLVLAGASDDAVAAAIVQRLADEVVAFARVALTRLDLVGKPAEVLLGGGVLQHADGEFMVLVGPSGSGKTTALRMLAGLEEVDAGAILIGGRDVTDLPPKERDVSMVFQNYALYPYLTVAANIGFPLRIAKVKKAEREKRVKEVATLLGLSEYLERKPGQLSGGQRQRVAMGRAIVRVPSVFLMDEPLSNLDAKLRVQMRADIAALQADFGITTVYV